MSLVMVLLVGVFSLVAILIAFKVLKALARAFLTLIVVATGGFLAYVYRAPLQEMWQQFTGG